MKGIGMTMLRIDIASLAHSSIVSQSVKEVLQSLVDDGLVQGDKIGSSNCTVVLQALAPVMPIT